MKFARYLEETQIPEWKRAYIDYRGLKKCITRIKQELQREGSTPLLPVSPVVDTRHVQAQSGTTENGDPVTLIPKVPAATLEPDIDDHTGQQRSEIYMQSTTSGSVPLHKPISSSEPVEPLKATASGKSREVDHNSEIHETQADDDTQHAMARFAGSASSIGSARKADDHGGTARPNLLRSVTLNMGFLPRLRRRSTLHNFWEPSHRNTRALQWDLAKSVPLKDLMPLLTSEQRAFFGKLDRELDKVEVFYVEREKEMKQRTTQLRAQLEELRNRGRAFQLAPDGNTSWLPSIIRRKQTATQSASETQTRKRRSYKADNGSPSRSAVRRKSRVEASKAIQEEVENTDSMSMQRQESDETAITSGSGSGEESKGWKKIRESLHKPRAMSPGSTPPAGFFTSWNDSDDYFHARKKLKKAVLECYRGLEILENYRTLNLIGFRKALKKFEKWTKIPAQQAYFVEKIEPAAFSSGSAVQSMLNEMERLYAARFTRGDIKLAKSRLRGHTQQKTHHFSTFRTGGLLGLAVPALVDGLYRSFHADTRKAIPAFGSLLYVYSIFLIPVLFGLLVGLNILVWSRNRINYVFIFELDVKTQLDHREYFEIPALLLCTLCYAFWLSFARIGSPYLSPIYWPLIWLLFAAFVMFDPLPLFFRRSRWWLIRNIARLLTSGVRRVEFADFWMGDQFCSLVYSLSNLYFVVCAYSGNFDSSWGRCSRPKYWGIPFVLGTLPFIARFVQSVKRWYDSGLGTHLINAGKYGVGIIYYLCYFIWRHDGGARGASFAVWCIFGTIYALYASAWDILMDWSLLRPRATYPFLRSDILYTNHIPLYYLVIVSNVLIRFIWVLYIPMRGPNVILRTWIGAMLEMLRRVQWNFYRLENEHVGNMDQYRVTREVPLPYSFDDGRDDDADEEDDVKSVSSWRKRKSKASSSPLDSTTGGTDGLALRTSRG